jgi:hypothetical protein
MRRVVTLLGIVCAVLALAAGGYGAWQQGWLAQLPMWSPQTALNNTPAQAPQASSRTNYVFAKASPLLVYDGPDLKTSLRQQAFEFGKPYEVVDYDDQFIKLKLSARETVHIRASHGTIVRRTSWLKATPAFMMADRPRIRMWESGVRLNEFLAGVNTSASQWDFEEYHSAAPKFRPILPVIETDTLDLLGGTRQVKLISAMVPIHRDAVTAFDASKMRPETQVSLHFLVDVSNSTNKFVDRAISPLVEQLGRNDALRSRIQSITLTTFGGPAAKQSEFVGSIALDRLRTYAWHRGNVMQPTAGEREPLTQGLLTLTSGIDGKPVALPIVIILSGADVMLNLGGRSETQKGRTISAIEDIQLPADASAIFAQVTPEPGQELRSASQKIKSATVRYVDFSESLGRDLVSEIARVADGQLNSAFTPEMFQPYAAAAHKNQMMALLPRVLSDKAVLPARQAYAAEAEWYSVRLWVTLDNLIWREVMDRDAPDDAPRRPDADKDPASRPEIAAPAGATPVRPRTADKRHHLEPPAEARFSIGNGPPTNRPLQYTGTLFQPAATPSSQPAMSAQTRVKLLKEHLERVPALREALDKTASNSAELSARIVALDNIALEAEALEKNSGIALPKPSASPPPAQPPSR